MCAQALAQARMDAGLKDSVAAIYEASRPKFRIAPEVVDALVAKVQEFWQVT